jgi:hypothetical protein
MSCATTSADGYRVMAAEEEHERTPPSGLRNLSADRANEAREAASRGLVGGLQSVGRWRRGDVPLGGVCDLHVWTDEPTIGRPRRHRPLVLRFPTRAAPNDMRFAKSTTSFAGENAQCFAPLPIDSVVEDCDAVCVTVGATTSRSMKPVTTSSEGVSRSKSMSSRARHLSFTACGRREVGER